MSNKFVEEAPYHPGYEDVGFKDETSRLIAEIDSFRKSNSRYLSFADVIVDFCSSSHSRLNTAK
jgi:ribosomal protein L31